MKINQTIPKIFNKIHETFQSFIDKITHLFTKTNKIHPETKSKKLLLNNYIIIQKKHLNRSSQMKNLTTFSNLQTNEKHPQSIWRRKRKNNL